MNCKAIVLSFLFIASFIVANQNPVIPVIAACNTARPTMGANEVNFDELEDQALSVNAYEGVHFGKPSRLLVLLRIVGMPLFNTYMKLSETMAKISAWMSAIFNKNEAKAHEARQ